MTKRIQIRMSKEMYDGIKKYSLENNFEDGQDAIREIIREKLEEDSSFIFRLKKLFFS